MERQPAQFYRMIFGILNVVMMTYMGKNLKTGYMYMHNWFLGGYLACSYQVAAATAAKSLQSCPTPCDPVDCSPPGSSVHGIFQVRVLEWGATAFSELVATSY